MLDSVYHMTLDTLKSHFGRENDHDFFQNIPKVVMDVINTSCN